jgi:hypothetical protein
MKRKDSELDAAAEARINAEEVGLVGAGAKPRQPATDHRHRARAWILIVLGVLLILAGVLLAIHKVRSVDLAPVGVGIATVLVGYRYLRREEIF